MQVNGSVTLDGTIGVNLTDAKSLASNSPHGAPHLADTIETTSNAKISVVINGQFDFTRKTFNPGDDSPSLVPGNFISLASAKTIDLGARSNLNAHNSANLFTTSFGQISFESQVTRTNGIYNRDSLTPVQILTPEKLFIDCSGSGSGTVNCDQALGVRAVLGFDAKKIAGAPPPLPTFQASAAGADAEAFVRTQAVLQRGSLSVSIYDNQMNFTDYFHHLSAASVPYTLLSEINFDGLLADAMVRSADLARNQVHSIEIVIRGSDPRELARNWLQGDFGGFGGGVVPPGTNRLAQYLSNLEAFAGSIQMANPGASLVFTGHSLGGGLALLAANDFHTQVYAFNAPPVGFVIGSLSSATTPITSAGTAQLLNFRLDGDPVSGLQKIIPNAPISQTVTLMGDPLLYFADHALANSPTLQKVAAQLPLVSLRKQAHLMENLNTYLNDRSNPVVEVDQGNTPIYTYDPSVNGVLQQLILQQLPKPTVGTPPGTTRYQGTVSNPGNISIVDLLQAPISILSEIPKSQAATLSGTHSGAAEALTGSLLAPGYDFLSNLKSQEFTSVFVPQLASTPQIFEIDTIANGQWIRTGNVTSGTVFDFAGSGVSEFRILDLQIGISDLTQISNAYLGIYVANIGASDFAITALTANGSPVPVPRSLSLLLSGILVLLILSTRELRTSVGADLKLSHGADATMSQLSRPKR